MGPRTRGAGRHPTTMKRAPRPRCRSRARGCLPALPEQAPPPQAPKKRRDHPPQRRRPRPGRPARARAPEPAAGPSGGPGGCPMTTRPRRPGVASGASPSKGQGFTAVAFQSSRTRRWRSIPARGGDSGRDGFGGPKLGRTSTMSPCASASLPAMLGAGGAGVRQKNRSGDRQGGKVANNFTSGVAATKRLEQERLRPDGGEKNVQRTVASRLGAVFASCPARTGMGGL